MVGKLIGAIVTALLGSVISVGISSIQGLISGSLNKNKDARQVESPSKARKQNISDTIAYIPIVVGRARVGGSRIFGETKLAYTGEETIEVQGTQVEQSTKGRFLYLLTVHSLGRIEDIEQVYLDNQAITHKKFNGSYKVDIGLNWSYAPGATVSTRSQASFYKILWKKANTVHIRNNIGVKDETIQVKKYDRTKYILYRKKSGSSQWKEIKVLSKSKQSVELTNVDYGTFEYLLVYKKARGDTYIVGNATVNITQENDDFVQTVNNNLSIYQDSKLRGEFIRLDKKLGTPNQSAISRWLGWNIPGYSSQMKGTGLALTGLRLLKHVKGQHAEKSPIQTIPAITADIKGIVCYDPRKDSTNTEAGGSGSHREDSESTWEWTQNPVLILRYYLLNEASGAGKEFKSEDIDDASVASAANYCDALISYNGKNFPRYVCNGVIDTGQRVVDNVQDLLSSFNGNLCWDLGRIRIKPLKAEPSVFSFNTDNTTGVITIDQGDIRQKLNTVNVKYVSEDLNWETDIITITNNAYVEEDQGKILEADLDLPFTSDYDHAYYLGMQFLKQKRIPKIIRIQGLWGTFKCIAGDVVDFTHPDLGYDHKLFRVENIEAETGSPVINFELSEYDEDVYTIHNIPVRANDQETNLDDPFNVQPPSNLTVAQNASFDNKGDYIGDLVTLDWDSSTSQDVVEYEIHYKPQALGEWKLLGKSPTTSLKTGDMLVGVYDIRIAARNTISAESEYYETQIEVYPPKIPPENVTGFKLQNGNNEVVLSWFGLPEVEIGGYYRIRHYRNTEGAQWYHLPTFDVIIPGSQTSVTLSQLNGTYFIKAGSAHGLESLLPAKYVLDLPENVDWQLVETIVEDPSFSGVKNDLEIIENKLTFTTTLLWDDLSGLMDDHNITTIDHLGDFAKANIGTYDFANSINLGAVYRVKLKVESDATLFAADLDMDSYTDTTIDEWDREFWDGSNPINVAINHLFSASRDGVSYSDYELLTVNELAGRYFQFSSDWMKAVTEEDAQMSSLAVKVYMRQRTEQGELTSSAASDVTKNFNKAFYQAPLVSATIDQAAIGDYLRINNITKNGFDISVYDNSNTRVSKRVVYVTQGVGEEVVA